MKPELYSRFPLTLSGADFEPPVAPDIPISNEQTAVSDAKRPRLDDSPTIQKVVSHQPTCELSVLTSNVCPKLRKAQLSSIVTKCTHQELVYLSEIIEPLLKRDFIKHLPVEISLHILSYLPVTDILNCAQVSSDWHRIASDPLLWYRFCKRDGIIETNVSKSRACACSTADNDEVENIQTKPSPSKHVEHDWKATYRYSLELRCNWLNGSPWPQLVVPAHHNHVITCLEVFENWAITGSDDSSLSIWNLLDGKLLITLFGHIGGVWSLTVLHPMAHLSSPLLVSGSCDRTARVWALDGSHWPCLTTLFGHQSTVRCLAGQLKSEEPTINLDSKVMAPDALVVTGSRDTTLRLWDALSGRCLHVLEGHIGAVRCVQFCGSVIVSGSYDCTVRVWCSRSGRCTHVLDEHQNRVYKLLFDGTRIISASLDTTICVWDSQSGALKHKFCGHQSLTSEMAYGHAQRILVSSNADETIRIWDVENGECLHVLAGRNKHESAVTCVQLTRHFIISSGDDGIVKLWDRNTGSYIRDLVQLEGARRGGVIWRIVASESRLVCAAGSRNGLETTKLIILTFGPEKTEAGTMHSCRIKTTCT